MSINYMRNNKEYTAGAILKNLDGNTGIVKATVLDYLGAELSPIRAEYAKRLGINGGVIVTNINSGLIKKQTSMKSSFVILKADDSRIATTDDLKNALEGKKKVRLEGFYPGDQYSNVYYYDLDLSNSIAF